MRFAGRMFNCMYMDMAMPMPTALRAHLLLSGMIRDGMRIC